MASTANIANIARLYGLNPYCGATARALHAFLTGQKLTVEHLRYLAVGSAAVVPVYNPQTGNLDQRARNVDLSYAATKPLLVPVKQFADRIETFHRQNAGRGSGPKAEIITVLLEQARIRMGQFVGYDPAYHVPIFSGNTSQGLNKLVRMASRQKNPFFVSSLAGHHSAQLPARTNGHSNFFNLNPDGTYDLNNLEDMVKRLGRRKNVFILVETQSNVTGYKNPIEAVCEIAGRNNATVFIDHAQGASSSPINLSGFACDRVHIVMSGHKTFARDGSGGLVGPIEFFMGAADEPAGGTVVGVTADQVFYSEPPHNQEPGTPAFIAQISFGKALDILLKAGLPQIGQRETMLNRLLWNLTQNVEGLTPLGARLEEVPRGPVFSFTLTGVDGKQIPPGFIGAALQYYWGIDTRVGQFCAHPFIYFLQKVAPKDALEHALLHQGKGRVGCAALPGDEKYHAARLSFAFPTREEDLLMLPDILGQIRRMWPDKSALRLDQEKGAFYLVGKTGQRLPQKEYDLCQDGPCRI